MPGITRGLVGSAYLAPGLRKILFDSYAEKPRQGQKLVNMQKMDRAWIDDANMAGFGPLLEKPEGGRVLYQDPMPGRSKRYVAATWGLGFRITEEMQEDAMYGFVASKFARALGRSVRYNFEVVSHSILNNAFNTAFNGFETGVSLISTAHTNIRGGTQSNRPAVDADLSLTTLQAAIEAFRGWQTEEGMPMMSTPKYLVVGPANMWIAGVLLGATLLPGGNFNDPNLLKNLGLTLIVDDYLTDPDSWYLIGDEHDMNYFDRRMPKFSNSDDFDSGDMKFKVTRRNAAGFGDWRGVYGSPGA
jgi:hypothetical protein